MWRHSANANNESTPTCPLHRDGLTLEPDLRISYFKMEAAVRIFTLPRSFVDHDGFILHKLHV